MYVCVFKIIRNERRTMIVLLRPPAFHRLVCSSHLLLPSLPPKLINPNNASATDGGDEVVTASDAVGPFNVEQALLKTEEVQVDLPGTGGFAEFPDLTFE